MIPLVDKSHPALRQKAQEVPGLTPEVRKLIKGMRKTLGASTGVGLAAPQVGESVAVFLLDVPSNPNQLPIRVDGKTVAQSSLRRMAVLNPKLTVSGENETDTEGCLSLPGEPYVPVTRKTHVELEFLAEDGEIHKIQADGFFARVIQHEFDHLQGILISDYQK